MGFFGLHQISGVEKKSKRGEEKEGDGADRGQFGVHGGGVVQRNKEKGRH